MVKTSFALNDNELDIPELQKTALEKRIFTPKHVFWVENIANPNAVGHEMPGHYADYFRISKDHDVEYLGPANRQSTLNKLQVKRMEQKVAIDKANDDSIIDDEPELTEAEAKLLVADTPTLKGKEYTRRKKATAQTKQKEDN